MRSIRLFGHEYAGWGHMGLLWYLLAAEELGLLQQTNERYALINTQDYSSSQIRFLLSSSILFLDLPAGLAMLSSRTDRKISKRFTPINFNKTEEFKLSCISKGIDYKPYFDRDLSAYHLVSSLWYEQRKNRSMIGTDHVIRSGIREWLLEIKRKFPNLEDRPVCFLHIRDSPGRHIRNCNPENYSLAIDYLISKGYTVYRSGIGRKIEPRNHLIQNVGCWSTEFDVPMLIKSSLAITCQSGPSYIAGLLNKPNLVVNVVSPVIGAMIHDHPKSAISIRSREDQEQSSIDILRSLVEYEEWAESGYPKNKLMNEVSEILRSKYNLKYGIEYGNIVGGNVRESSILERNTLLRRQLEALSYSLD